MNNKPLIEYFFEDILPEITSGSVIIDEFRYNIGFNTLILSDGKETLISSKLKRDAQRPMLIIKDMDKFCAALNKYNDFCHESNIIDNRTYIRLSKQDRIKYNLSLIWGASTVDDFNNPVAFLERYTNFIRDTSFICFDSMPVSNKVAELDNSSIEILRLPQPSNFETPYLLEMCLTKQYDEKNKLIFTLPSIRYGIDCDLDGKKTGYIYAIQKKEDKIIPSNNPAFDEANEKYNKKMNRLLYKLNNGVNEQESDEYKEYKNNTGEYYPENISDVSPSALVSLTIMMGLMKSANIDIIKAPDYLPLRWHCKEDMYRRKLDYMIKTLRLEEKLKKAQLNQNQVKYECELDNSIRQGKEEVIVDAFYNNAKDDMNVGNLELILQKIKNGKKIEQYKEYIVEEQIRIQKNITDKFIRSFRRLDYHFNNLSIISLPGELSSFMELKIGEKVDDNCNNIILGNVYEEALNYNKPRHKSNI
jgi:hypothetical protein